MTKVLLIRQITRTWWPPWCVTIIWLRPSVPICGIASIFHQQLIWYHPKYFQSPQHNISSMEDVVGDVVGVRQRWSYWWWWWGTPIYFFSFYISLFLFLSLIFFSLFFLFFIYVVTCFLYFPLIFLSFYLHGFLNIFLTKIKIRKKETKEEDGEEHGGI